MISAKFSSQRLSCTTIKRLMRDQLSAIDKKLRQDRGNIESIKKGYEKLFGGIASGN